MKNWKKLKSDDFECEDWSERPSAQVDFNDQELDIDIPESKFANDEVIQLCKNALQAWLENGELISSLTEDLVQSFLPGKKVTFHDLSLWQLGVIDREGNLVAIVYRYCLGGNYDNENFDLEQFDSESTVELQLSLKDFKPIWDKPHLSTTNDFD